MAEATKLPFARNAGPRYHACMLVAPLSRSGMTRPSILIAADRPLLLPAWSDHACTLAAVADQWTRCSRSGMLVGAHGALEVERDADQSGRGGAR
jgi:hypothetical protein